MSCDNSQTSHQNHAKDHKWIRRYDDIVPYWYLFSYNFVIHFVDWNATSYDGEVPIPNEYRSFILPMVLNYLCPLPVAVLGLGVVAAAVMSSADSSVLSSGTIFAKNIYKDVIRPQVPLKCVSQNDHK